MNDNTDIDTEMKTLRKQIEDYRNLEEHEKINKSIQLKKDINKCKKKINNFLHQINNPSDYLEYSLETESDEDGKLTEHLANIENIKKDFKDNLTLDEKVSLFIDLVRSIDWIEDYLEDKKNITIEYLK